MRALVALDADGDLTGQARLLATEMQVIRRIFRWIIEVKWKPKWVWQDRISFSFVGL